MLDDDQGRFRLVERGHRDVVLLRQFVWRIKKRDIGMCALQHRCSFAAEDFGPAFEPECRQVFANHLNRPTVLLDK